MGFACAVSFSTLGGSSPSSWKVIPRSCARLKAILPLRGAAWAQKCHRTRPGTIRGDLATRLLTEARCDDDCGQGMDPQPPVSGTYLRRGPTSSAAGITQRTGHALSTQGLQERCHPFRRRQIREAVLQQILRDSRRVLAGAQITDRVEGVVGMPGPGILYATFVTGCRKTVFSFSGCARRGSPR